MENAAKALLIAAGTMLAIMILSLLVLTYGQISGFFNEQSEKNRQEQLHKFNKEFQNYNRDDIRGTELITLINKVIDYNERQVYAEGTGYERVLITIDMKNNETIQQFKYPNSETSIFDSIKISNNSAEGTNQEKDSSLLKVTYLETDLIQEAREVDIEKLTSVKLQKLAANIENIIFKEEWTTEPEKESIELQQQKRTELLTRILGQEFKENDTTQLAKIKEMTQKYYQYMQFKRAYFKCENMKFNQNTGRVSEINVTIKINDNKVVFN